MGPHRLGREEDPSGTHIRHGRACHTRRVAPRQSNLSETRLIDSGERVLFVARSFVQTV